MITRELTFEINREKVLNQIDCYAGSDLYEEVTEEYEEILDEMKSLIEPVFLMEPGTIGPELAREGLPEGTPVLMALYSIGRGISDYSTAAFAAGDYLKGMLADAIADSALFSLEQSFAPILKETCAEMNMGIRRRLEAPQDICMTAQKVIYEKTRAHELCGMEISSGYMLDPVKSNAVLYVLTEDRKVFLHQHNCRNCNRYDCKMRNIPDIPVRVSGGCGEEILMVKEGQSILDALMQKDPSFTAVCGGTGRCGKCRIRVLEGYLPETPSDLARLTQEERNSGYRLACRAFPSEPVQITLCFRNESDFMVVSDYAEEQKKTPDSQKSGAEREGDLGIAIDIGTTTIAIQLLSLNVKAPIRTYTVINHQRSFGADVISRIQASTEGKGPQLRESIRRDLDEGIRRIVEESGVLAGQIKKVAIAGNTTMTHLLMGYDCKSLGVYPFTPVNIGMIEDTYETVFGSDFLSAQVRIMPGISTFVGGDIVAGLYDCDVDRKEEYSLLIDLGTNGEIALGNCHKIMATSTAAGPAFEGGNITWGVGSIEGAIAGVTITDKTPHVKTIGNRRPTGICGTGVVETVAELVKAELVDETGCLDEEYFEEGFPLAETADGRKIVLTQQDVREIQLAKAAVRAGIETLFLRYGISREEVSRVYLAGGFGFKLDCQKAIEIGMIPEEFSEKIEAVGNSSLGGTVKCLLSDDGWDRASAMGLQAEEINLSADKDFNRFYMDYMYFEKD